MRPSREQLRVVESPLVSLRVTATAGTGKTSTLAWRVVELVTRHGVDPEAILGLTFTNKAAEELADRIRAMLGGRIEVGREVEVHTYHGFAASILREFGVLVGIERDTPIITPAYAHRLLMDLLDRFDWDSFDPTIPAAVDRILTLGGRLADNLVDPVTVLGAATEEEPWPARKEMLELLSAYEEEKRRMGVADYGDLITKAHRLVVDHPDVAEKIAARYRAVLLDEYQDTNPAQRELLRRLFAGRVPVTAVGDPYQTIYEWRGASPANFADFPQHFANPEGPAPTLELTVNRRSGWKILELANRLVEELSGSVRLRPRPDALPGSVETAWFDTAVQEAEWLASTIGDLHETGTAWRDMAILFRKNKDMLLVHQALAVHDIPFEVANLGGLLGVPEVVDLHAWLRLLERPDDGPAAARILLGPRYRLGLADLAVISRQVRLSVDPADPDREVPIGVAEVVDRLEGFEGLSDEARARLEEFRSEYGELVASAQQLSLVELCRTILDRIGAWDEIEAMEPNSALSARLNLHRFLDLAESWSPLDGRPTLRAFLAHLEALDQEHAEELDTARLSGADAVTLITVHRAKGLEWPVVFLPAVYRGNFPTRGGAYDDPTSRPESLPFEFRLDPGPPESADLREWLQQNRIRQEWRVAYVAVTRAKERLYVTGAHWYGHPEPNQNPVPPSELWEHAAGVGSTIGDPPGEPPPRPEVMVVGTPSTAAEDPLLGEDPNRFLEEVVEDPELPRRVAEERGVVAEYHTAVEDHRQLVLDISVPRTVEPATRMEMSATGLVTYRTCPLRFYWTEVDRLPRRGGRAATRGVQIHRRIELHLRGRVPLEELDPELYDAVEWDGAQTTGADPFRNFLASRFSEQPPLLVEAPFHLVLEPDVVIRGRIDAVYDRGDHWEVVDFKSGRKPDGPVPPVQLQVYGLAIRHVEFGRPRPDRLRLTFAYLGGNTCEEVTYVADAEWLEEARREIEDLVGGITEGRFDPAPSPACRNCDFVRFCPPGAEYLSAE
ncbi:MAG: putative ATP-dependent DNA helicase [Acidimicrobiia bacterium]|nr:MAG: putative ATP-dependent DNA helicase [Acidimicrobiia bacterium]